MAMRRKSARTARTAGPAPLQYALPARVFNRALPAVLLVVAVFLAFPGVAAAAPTKLLVLGDSLAAGYGLPPDQSFAAQLERRLRQAGREVEVLNGGVSGDTTAGGRARVGWALADKPDAAIVEFGANDALRGVDPAATRANLDAILAELKRAGVKVLLAGMRAPPNWGRDYERAFDAIFPALAEKHGVPLYPFFLEGVATVRQLNQPDGIHPNAKGVAEIVDRIAPSVLRLLDGRRGD